MIETYATRCQALALVLDVEASAPCEVRISGYDAEQDYSTYFQRRVGHKEPFTGRHKLVFPLPVTPERLRVKVELSTGFGVVHDYQFVPLEKNDAGLSAQDRDAVDFALWLAVNLPLLPITAGDRFPYQSGGGRLMAILRKRILNSDGTENSTPARISRPTGIMEVSQQKLLPVTVPIRLLVLLHEYSHYRLNSTDESECDLHGLAIFCALGYSSLEGLYTFTRMLEDAPDKPELRRRTAKVLDMLLAYQAREPRYTAYLS